MKVINPFYTSKVQTFAQNNKEVINNFLMGNGESSEITFDAIRAAFPAVKDPKTGSVPMTDGTIAAIFAELGYQVTE